MYPFGKGFNRFIPLLLLLIPMALYIVFYFGPSILTVIYSFTDVKNLPGSTYQFVGLDNYKDLFFSGNSGERWRSIINTLIFMFVVTIVQNGVALFIAVIINQRLKGDYFYRAVFFLPVVLGVAVVALIWGMMFDPLNGPVNRLYDVLFGYQDMFFGSFTHAFGYIIFVQIWMYMGYSMLIFLAGLQSVPKDLYEAGHIDGTSKWQSFRHITFPLIAPSFTVNMLLSIIGAMSTFDIILATTDGRFNTRTMAYDVYKETFRGSLEMGLPSALSVIQFLIILLFVVVAVRQTRKREVEY
ncbi:binding-protein-dependent transport systems inner membrane component [Paenibacillus vortex V453]|jgi:raffinose/stachyose/melibiose transport system permease protein|uniref:Sugar ABC transporter permease n=2 Tax=Paenibacillus TaxID=44249 RepID=A0A163FKL6_9BACL|nr:MULTISPECIES: sugar ABC transporter permease [Paenibacillus]ANA79040.1 sugar ABC transporter permease [Paenibacillus glucanolyticus]AVV57044.1 sugar ABC transporter permease [Paenibacillus glucanolyticus]AWP26186.1 sugar ABC transporter permease [Paenibacillus sp. Cedars]EFU39005.1 binding-protein-dependent transport systems inner membrane component [Paenibacillus vortex V453]ETT39422.1 binding-protein-dependent transport systems inner membrane component [Paenibacillus sp. FSL R5-808]